VTDPGVLGVFVAVYAGMILGEIPGLALDRSGIARPGASASDRPAHGVAALRADGRLRPVPPRGHRQRGRPAHRRTRSSSQGDARSGRRGCRQRRFNPVPFLLGLAAALVYLRG
jgi:hypothetical protein